MGMVKDLTGPFQELGSEYKDLSNEVMSFVQDELDRMIDFIGTLAVEPYQFSVKVSVQILTCHRTRNRAGTVPRNDAGSRPSNLFSRVSHPVGHRGHPRTTPTQDPVHPSRPTPNLPRH